MSGTQVPSTICGVTCSLEVTKGRRTEWMIAYLQLLPGCRIHPFCALVTQTFLGTCFSYCNCTCRSGPISLSLPHPSTSQSPDIFALSFVCEFLSCVLRLPIFLYCHLGMLEKEMEIKAGIQITKLRWKSYCIFLKQLHFGNLGENTLTYLK